MVYRTRAVDNLITAVTVNISYTQIVIALTGVVGAARIVAVEDPTLS
jgi:type II secretory pathway predicted ATPase ExeA